MKLRKMFAVAAMAGSILAPSLACGALCLCFNKRDGSRGWVEVPTIGCGDLGPLAPGEKCYDAVAMAVLPPHTVEGALYDTTPALNGSTILTQIGSVKIVGRFDGLNFAVRPSAAYPGLVEAAPLPNAPDLATQGVFVVGAELLGHPMDLPASLGGAHLGEVTSGDFSIYFVALNPTTHAIIQSRVVPVQLGGLVYTVQGLPPQDCVSQCPPSERTTICYEAGRADDFTAPVDPLSPRPVLLTTPVGSTYTGFDDPTPNRLVAHTFKNLPCGIQTAMLTVTMKALPDIPENDTIALNRPTLWGSSIAALPGNGGTWHSGQMLTITLDLAALPGGGNIIASLNALHYVDLILQDDTMVDFAKLVITVCPCNGPYRVLHAGLKDSFAPVPVDPPPYLRPALAALRTTAPFLWNGFDNTQVDRGVGHSFSVPPGIINAQLLVRAMPITNQTGGSNNDGINFELKPLGGPAAFYRSFNYNLLTATGGTWYTPSNPATTLSFDLGTTPPSDFSCPNFLGAMADGLFDVYSQDDTKIDWMDLKVWTCPPPRFDCGIPVYATGQAALDVRPMQTTITNIGGTGQDGVRLEIPGADGFCAKLQPRNLSSFPAGSSLDVAVSIGDVEPATGSSLAGTLSIQMLTPQPRLIAAFPTSPSSGVNIVACDTGYESQAVFVPDGGFVGLSPDARVVGVDWSYNFDVPNNNPPTDRTDAFVVRFENPTDFSTSSGVVLTGRIIKIIRPVPCFDRVAYATIGGTNLGTLQLMGVMPQQFGFLQTATGAATVEAGDGSLTVANIGGTGQDGVEINFGKAEVASIAFNVSPGATADLWPLNGDLDVAYIGSHGGVPDRYLGYTSFSRRNGVGQLYADYSPVGANLKLVQVLQGGVLVGEVPSVPGFLIATITPRCEPICLPECYFACTGELPDDCGKGAAIVNGLRSACGRWHWPKPVIFGIYNGLVPLEGDEIRILAQNADAPFDYVQSIAITGKGMDEITFSGESATQIDETPPYCPADYNQDGGIDGADVSAFFFDWEAGNSNADVNQDGGVDGADVGTFFFYWERGGC